MPAPINRRRLIKTLSLSTASLLLSPSSIPSACGSREQQKRGLGVALVGLGYYSTDLLAPALQQTKHCYLAGIVTGTPAKAEAWKKKYNIPDKNIYNYSNFDEIANNPDIDVVYVVLPPSIHREYAVRAANAGKHVWCEKPMAITEAECREMIDACNKNKRTLSIGYRLQHEPTTQAWRRIVTEKNWARFKALVVPPATAKAAQTTGSKRKRWAAALCTIWVCMPFRVPAWVPEWNPLLLFRPKPLPQDPRFIKTVG